MIDEYALWQAMQRTKAAPGGLALWLAWQMDLGAGAITALTWDQVDLEEGTILQSGRALPLTQALWRILREVQAARPTGSDPHVLLTAGGRPMDVPGLSRLVSATLAREGLPGATLRDLRRGLREDQETALLRLGQQRPFLTAADAADLLGLSREAAGKCLRRLWERGKLQRLGNRYYISLLPPADREAAVRDYISKTGFAYRQDIARLLGVEERQCGALLRGMVERGELRLDQRRYTLPENEKL